MAGPRLLSGHLPGRQGNRAPTIVPCRLDTPVVTARCRVIVLEAEPLRIQRIPSSPLTPAHFPDGHDDPLIGRPGLVPLSGDEPADGRAGMLDDVLAQLPSGLEELVHDLTVGATLQPLPDEPGQAVAAVRVVEALQLDQGVPTIALGDLRKAPRTRTAKLSTSSVKTASRCRASTAVGRSIGMSASIAHLGTLDRNLAISVDTGQGLADRPVQRRRDCQELTAWVAAVPLRGMGMPPEMVAGTQRDLVMARPWVVRRRTPLWAVTPPRE
jgi:hypothetical protein